MGLGRHVPPGRKRRHRHAAWGVLVFMLGGFAALGAPAAPSDYPAYLAQHQAELGPFFVDHGCEMVKDGLHLLIATGGNILLATALAGWVLDIFLAWGYSTVFSPAYARFPRALIYASGRLVLALMLTIVLTFLAMLGVNAGAGVPALTIVAVLTIPAVFVQVFWVGYLYHTGAKPSLLFYVLLLAVHAVICVVLVPTVFSSQVATTAGKFMNESVVPILRTEADTAKREADALALKRDATRAQADALTAGFSHDEAEESDLQRKIEAGRNSPAVQFARLVVLRAQGNLGDAAKGLADFIAKYPADPHADAARGQLAAVNEALSAQLALQHQQELQDAQAAAVARRQLLADANAGRATLSEMRRALLGKTPAQVTTLFGVPTETGADKWGYGKRMIVDPESGEHRGLTVLFSEGIVQGVDYYYGEAQ